MRAGVGSVSVPTKGQGRPAVANCWGREQMGLKITRRPGESVSMYDERGQLVAQVTLLRAGPEPMLDFVARADVKIRRDDQLPTAACQVASACESRAA